MHAYPGTPVGQLFGHLRGQGAGGMQLPPGIPPLSSHSVSKKNRIPRQGMEHQASWRWAHKPMVFAICAWMMCSCTICLAADPAATPASASTLVALNRRFRIENRVRSHLRTAALKTENFNKKSVVLVKCKNGFTKTVPWTENPGKTRRRAF